MQEEGKGWVAWLILLGESLMCEKIDDLCEAEAGGCLVLVLIVVQMLGQGKGKQRFVLTN